MYMYNIPMMYMMYRTYRRPQRRQRFPGSLMRYGIPRNRPNGETEVAQASCKAQENCFIKSDSP